MYSHHLQKLARTRLEDVLLDEGILDRAQIELAVQDAQQGNLPLSQVLAEREVLDEWQLAKLISVHYSLPFVDLSDLSLMVEKYTKDDALLARADELVEHHVYRRDAKKTATS